MREFINANDTVREDDYQTVMAAIREACEDGCRTVKIPRYNKRTGGTVWSFLHVIELPSDFTLLLDNCYLEQGRGSYENLIANEHINDDEYLKDPNHRAHNIKIIGEGNVTLSGGKHNLLLEMTTRRMGLPKMWSQPILLFWNLDGLTVENVNVRDQRWWSICHCYVANASYKNIRLFAYPHVCNMDGIDMRVGCHHFTFENITGRTGDDVIATTALQGRSEVEHSIPGMPLDIHDIKIRNLKASSHNCMLIRLLNHDTAKEYNYDIDTVMDSSDPNSFRPGNGIGIGSPFYFSKVQAKPGDTGHIRIRNFYSRANVPIRLACVCNDLQMSNIHVFSNAPKVLDTFTDGLWVKNIKMDHIYYSFNQPTYDDGTKVPREAYNGLLVDLPNTEGDVTIEHFYSDPVRDGFKVSGKIDLRVSDFRCDDVVNFVSTDENSLVTVNGEQL